MIRKDVWTDRAAKAWEKAWNNPSRTRNAKAYQRLVAIRHWLDSRYARVAWEHFWTDYTPYMGKGKS